MKLSNILSDIKFAENFPDIDFYIILSIGRYKKEGETLEYIKVYLEIYDSESVGAEKFDQIKNYFQQFPCAYFEMYGIKGGYLENKKPAYCEIIRKKPYKSNDLRSVNETNSIYKRSNNDNT